jgi:hypothetical protein
MRMLPLCGRKKDKETDRKT